MTGGGHTDTYWVGLGLSLMGAAHRIDEATGFAQWNIEDYGPEIAHDMHVGHPPEAIRSAIEGDGAAPSFGRNALDAIVAGLGMTPVWVTSSSEPVLAETVRLEQPRSGHRAGAGHRDHGGGRGANGTGRSVPV